MKRAKYTVSLAAALLALGLGTQAMAREVIFTGESCPLTVITDLSAYLERPQTQEEEVVYRTVASQGQDGQAGADLSDAYVADPEEAALAAAEQAEPEQPVTEQAQSEQAVTEPAAGQPQAAAQEDTAAREDTAVQAEDGEGEAEQAQTDQADAGQAQSEEAPADADLPEESGSDQPAPAQTEGQAQTDASAEDAAQTEADVFQPQTFVSDGVLMTLPSEEVTLSSFDALGIIDNTYVMISYDGGKIGWLSTDEIDAKVPDMNGRLMRELPSANGWTTLEQGSDGEMVTQAQQVLSDLGFLEGEVDGLYGGGTAASVQRFQESEGLPVTGQIDAFTWIGLLRAGDPSLREVKPLETVYPPVYEARKKFHLIYNDVADTDYLDQFLDPEWKIKYDVFSGEGKIDYTRNGLDLGTKDVGNRRIDKVRLNACMYVDLRRMDTGAIRPRPVIEVRAEGSHLPYIKDATLTYGIYSEDMELVRREAALSGMNSVETAVLEITWDIYSMLRVELGGGDLILHLHGEERDFEMDLTGYLPQIELFTDACFNMNTEGQVVEEEEEEEEDFYTEEEPSSETEMSEQEFAISTPDTVTEEADASAVFNASTTDETSESGSSDTDEAAAQAAPAPGIFQDETADSETEAASEVSEPAPEDTWTSQEAEVTAVEPETVAAVDEGMAGQAEAAE